MSWTARLIVLLLLGATVGFIGGWKLQGWRLQSEIAKIQASHKNTLDKLESKTLEAEQEFREREQSYAAALAFAQEERNAEVVRINRQHTATVASLRQRPERVTAVYCPGSEMPSTPAACVGTTGAELARGDAEFLAGYAADAARLEAALNQCEAAYRAVQTNE